MDDTYGLTEVEITQFAEDWEYYKLAKKLMKHTCHDGVNGCLDSNGRCKRGNVNDFELFFCLCIVTLYVLV